MKTLIILSLDLRNRSAGEICLVTPHEVNRVELNNQDSAAVLEAIDQLLSQAKLQPAEVNVLKFYPGPGSFIGLRVAASLINAWASQCSVTVVDDRGKTLPLPVLPQYGGEYVISKVTRTQ